METPRYLQILWAHKVLLLLSLVLAAVAGLFAGFSVSSNGFTARTASSYSSTTTVLVQSPNSNPFSGVTEVPNSTPTTLAQTSDPAQLALIYAYLVTGDVVRRDVEAEVGTLRSDESISAVRRTTQPGGDERFPGRDQLPIIDIIGVAATPQRAESIANAARAAFFEYSMAQQVRAGISEGKRIRLEEVKGARTAQATGSNPFIPVLLGFVGALIFLLASIFVIDALQSASRRRRATEVEAAVPGDVAEGRRRRRETASAS